MFSLDDTIMVNDLELFSDHDVSNYVWSENIHDIMANSAWVSVSSRAGALNTGPLIMKAKAISPTVQR